MKKILILKILLILILSSCANKSNSIIKKLSSLDSDNIHYKGHYKAGGTYTIRNKKYKALKDVHCHTAIGFASWYGGNNHGKKTANGDQFKKNLLTAAHRQLPLPALIKVTNLYNQKSVILLVNDRGPFPSAKQNKLFNDKKLNLQANNKHNNILDNSFNNIKRKPYNRIIDVSEEAAKVLGFKHQGLAKVKIEYLYNETDQLLKDLKLEKKNGAYAKKANKIALKQNKCSINCKLMLLNIENNNIKL